MRHETHAARMDRLLRTLPPAVRGMAFGDPDDAEYAHASDVVAWAINEIDRLTAERNAAIRERDAALARVAVLRAAPAANAGGEQSQPPRGWLTAEEREVVKRLSPSGDPLASRTVTLTPDERRVFHTLLARSTPPKVKGPLWAYDAHDMAWIAAIREAGGEVE